jgi:hypothetical protein
MESLTMSKIIRFAATLVCAAVSLVPATAVAQGEPSFIDCQYGFAVIFPSPPTARDIGYSTNTGAIVPARQFFLEQGADRFMVTVATFSGGPAVDLREMEHAATTLSTRGELRYEGSGEYEPGLPGRQLNIFERSGRQIRASVYMVERRLYITEVSAAPGDFPALQFEQSITLIDSMGIDRTHMPPDEPRKFTCR